MAVSAPAPDSAARDGVATVLLPHTTTSVGAARAEVQRDLVSKGLPADVVDTTVLVVSEIVSNALKHARPLRDGKVRISWSAAPDAVELEVTDGGGATRPRLTGAPVTAGAGRGLTVVRRLSREWGVREASAETTVWAVIDLDDRTATPASPVVTRQQGAERRAAPVPGALDLPASGGPAR